MKSLNEVTELIWISHRYLILSQTQMNLRIPLPQFILLSVYPGQKLKPESQE